MTEQQKALASDEHSRLLALIPWYVKGTLNQKEYALIEEHLQHCEMCRQEVASCATLAKSVPLPTDTWKPSAAHFSRILAAVDKLEAETAKQAKPLTVNNKIDKKPKISFFQQLKSWFAQTPLPVRWTLAVETLAVAALALLVVLPLRPKLNPDDVYETLSNAETPIKSTDGVAIRLVFADDMTAKELSDLLKRANAQIQQGPSAVGSYIVSVTAKDTAQALGILRGNPKVRLAQPIEPNTAE